MESPQRADTIQHPSRYRQSGSPNNHRAWPIYTDSMPSEGADTYPPSVVSVMIELPSGSDAHSFPFVPSHNGAHI